MRRSSRLAFAAVLATLASSQGRSQVVPQSASSAFTAEDALDLVTFAVGDVSLDGRWLAATSTSRRDGLTIDYRRDGDPTYVRPASLRVWVIDTKSGERRSVFPDKRNVRALRWSPDGTRLGMLLVDGDAYRPAIWDRASAKLTVLRMPPGSYVAENSDLQWLPDGSKVVVALHTLDWRRAVQDSFAVYTRGPVFVQSSKDPFLSWDWLRRSASSRRVVSIDIKTGTTADVLNDGMISGWDVSDDGRTLTWSEDVTKKTDYDVIFGTDNTLRTRPFAGGEARTLFPSLKGITVVWSDDGKHYAYGKDGRVYIASVDDTTSKQVAGSSADAKKDASDTTKEARARREAERFAPVRYSPTADALILSNKEGLWYLDLASTTKSLIIAASDSNPSSPRANVLAWSRDGNSIYLGVQSRLKWERGISRFARDTKRLMELVKDGRSYSNFRLSKDGSTAILSIADGNRPAELYVGDASLSALRPLTDANPQLKQKRLATTELLTYLDADGHKKYGVVYYPADYRRGVPAPTVFNIYEDFFDDTFDPTINVLTSAGYVVVRPSVDFDIGYPGEAWVKGVTAAANKLIEMGVADSTRLGVHGTSYGGYATNLLITQTNRFRAAINISGKVDIISFYTDSPRLGVRNVHAAEKSQDRLGATLWQQPQKYVQHSAIMFADRIQTPLMLITGAQDSNVPADNTREMYYALRRLGKEVVWVNYMNGGHGGGNASPADFLDMHRRMLEWYDAKLKRASTTTRADAVSSSPNLRFH
jgi:dipeptidyl aminopeptidase/acylaminoacyl peptidase